MSPSVPAPPVMPETRHVCVCVGGGGWGGGPLGGGGEGDALGGWVKFEYE
jgi:hypothetical protein